MMAEWNHQIGPQHHEHGSDESSEDKEDYAIEEDVVRQPIDDFLRANNRLLHRRGRNGELRSMSPPQPNGHNRQKPYTGAAKQPSGTSKRRWGRTVQWVVFFLVGGYLFMVTGGYILLKRHDDTSRTFIDRSSFLEPKGPLYALRERLEERRLTERNTLLSLEAQRANVRKQRTRPPIQRIEAELPPYQYNVISMEAESRRTSNDQALATADALCGEHAREAAQLTPNSFAAQDALNSKSRVLITGILNPIGFHLALALKERCGVEIMGGIDPLFPNTVEQRLAVQKRIQILTTNIPKLLHPIGQPLVGLDPKPSKQTKGSADVLPVTEEPNVLSMNPTHVVHLATYMADEHEDFGDDSLRNLQSPYVGDKRKPDMFVVRSSQVAMEQILASMAPERKPHFTYASGNAIIKLMDEVLADSYSALKDIYSVGLRLPDVVYGPWGRPRSPIHEVCTATIAELRGNGTATPFSEVYRDFSYVDDIVNGIIASMQYRAEDRRSTLFDLSSDTRFNVESSRQFVSQLTKTKTSLPKMVQPQVSRRKLTDLAIQTRSLLSWSPTTPISIGLAKTMAWHLDHSFPYGDKVDQKGGVETGDQFRMRVGIDTCSTDDLLCHVGRKYLPCLSECSTQSQCIPSIFEGVASLMVESTEGCDVALYTQSLGYDVEDLTLTATYSDDGDVMVCNFAFVPESSKLVEAVIKKVPEGKLSAFGVKKTNDEDLLHKRKIKALNGRLLYKGWILVWVKDAHEPLPNHDMYALKMSPGKLFSKDVQHAVFVNEKFPFSPNREDVLFLVSQTHRPPLPERNAYRKMKDGKKLKYRLAAEPERRAAIVMSPLKYKKHSENGLPAKISVYEATKYMQVEIGEKPEAKESAGVKRQREFYERVPTFINKLDFRSINEAWYKYELKNWVRTRWIVHDLHLEEARQIRCEWYHEHIQWDNKLDQLSFAHVMASREIERRIAFQEPDDHVKSVYMDHPEYLHLSDAHEWYPVESEMNRVVHANQPLKPLTLIADHLVDHVEKEQEHPENSLADSVKLTTSEGRDVPLFIRIVSEGVMMKSRELWALEHPPKKKK